MFRIIVPAYNAANWIRTNIQSIKSQCDTLFTCVIVDDASSDGTADIAEKAIGYDERFNLIRNEERKLALANIVTAIDCCGATKEDVIVTVDGDDWLAHDRVLKKLFEVYWDDSTWMTYGNYQFHPSGAKSTQCKAYPANIVQNRAYRDTTFNASHLRTFKYGLWQHIDQRDMKTRKGKYFDMTWDMAFMFPMLEMSGPRAKFIDEVLYIYNLENPINDHKVDAARQQELDRYIRNMKRYDRLEEL